MIRIVMLLIACLWASAARADWHEASSRHFVVYSDDRPERVKEFAERLERFDRIMRLRLNQPDPAVSPANRVTVYVVPDTGEVGRLAGSSTIAGLYIPRAGGSLALVPRRDSDGIGAQAVLFHEYAHHFMLSAFADAVFPAWFVEGFAEFYGTTTIERDGTATVGRPPLHRGYEFSLGTIQPSDLLALRRRGRPDQPTFYASAWLITHYLHFASDRGGQLGKYIKAINTGTSAEEAIKAFGDLDVLDREVDRYVRQRRISAYTIKAEALKIDPVTIRPLGAGEAAVMAARIRSKRGVDAKEAKAVLTVARRAAAPYPNDPAAQIELAEAEYDAGNYREAQEAADRALATDPRLIDGHVYRGMAQMALASAEKSEDVERWNAIRASFIRANALENDDPEPLRLFYQTYLNQGIEPTRNARNALLRAHQLGPQDAGLRMEAAAMLVQDDRGDEARAILGPLAYAPHGGPLTEAALALIAAIDSDDEDGAKALAGTPAEPNSADK